MLQLRTSADLLRRVFTAWQRHTRETRPAASVAGAVPISPSASLLPAPAGRTPSSVLLTPGTPSGGGPQDVVRRARLGKPSDCCALIVTASLARGSHGAHPPCLAAPASCRGAPLAVRQTAAPLRRLCALTCVAAAGTPRTPSGTTLPHRASMPRLVGPLKVSSPASSTSTLRTGLRFGSKPQ